MKNKPLLLSLFMLAAMFVSQTAWAAYLHVGGVNVNLNATTTQTITGSGISGTVIYSPSEKTLYLENATIDIGTTDAGIIGEGLGSSASTRYFIHLKGVNTIKSSLSCILFKDSYVVLYGNTGSSLNINNLDASGSAFSCIETKGGHFEVWGIALSLMGKYHAFVGDYGTETLSFVNSIVNAVGGYGAIRNYKSLSFDDCKCASEGVTFKSGYGYVDEHGALAPIVSIQPLLMVGNEPVRTAADSRTGSKYPWKWTKSTKTLEITGDISAPNYYAAIANWGIEGLIIKTVGNYNVSADYSNGFHIKAKTSFEGTGTLNITSGSENAIEAHADVEVYLLGLTAKGKKHGFTDAGSGCRLILESFNVDTDYRFAGAEEGDVLASDLILRGVDISNANTWWNPADGFVYYRDEIRKSTSVGSQSVCTCLQSTSKIDYFDVRIGETQIRRNCTDYIACRGLTSGTITYTTLPRTLTLDNATLTNLDGDLGCGIILNSNMPKSRLTINLIGTNNINVRNCVIMSCKDIVISGSGTLNGTSRDFIGLEIDDGKTTTIDGPQVNLTGVYGVRSLTGGAQLRVIGNSNVVLNTWDSSEPTISDLSYMTLDDGVTIAEPVGGYFDRSLRSITTDGITPYKGKVVIGQPIYYGMSIGETSVTSTNAADILGNGQFKYDPSTKTLTLTNATLENDGPSGSGINNREIEGLNIKLVGDNSVTVRNYSIYSSHSFSITGDGKLTAQSAEAAGLFLSGENTVCTIDGPQLDITGASYGLQDWKGTATLIVKGSTTSLTLQSASSYYPAVYNLDELTLGSGICIVEPRGGYFDASLGSITTDGTSSYKGKVVIRENVDFAATPADPQIINFAPANSYPSINFFIPTKDVVGNALQTSKLFYTVWTETEGVKTPFVVRASVYRDVTEDMVEIPYEYDDGFDIYEGGSLFYINPIDEPAYCTKFGVQSIYYGGGERNTSNIVWVDNPAFNPTGIRSIDDDANGQMANGEWSNGKCFNLNGQRLTKIRKGINIINGKKILVK